MDGWTPIFDIIVDSSLWCEPDYVIKVYLTMLAKKDRNHIVRGSAFNIAQWAKKTEAETLDALNILAAPDTKRIEPQEFEGRRIEKTPEGWWHILNGEKYRQMVSQIKSRSYRTMWQAEARAKEKAKSDGIPATPAKNGTFHPPTIEEVKLLCAKSGLPDSEADKFFNYYSANGWKVGKNKMQSVPHAVGGWAARWREGGSQQPKPQPRQNMI